MSKRDFWTGRREVCKYAFWHPNTGELLFRKIRYELDPELWKGREKTFTYSTPGLRCRRLNAGRDCAWLARWRRKNRGDVWRYTNHPHKPLDADLYLYRIPSYLEGLTVHWVEGEKDADAVWRAGGIGVSHHGGAGSATESQARWLLGAKQVILWADRDAGEGARDALRRYELLVRCGYPHQRIRFVRAAVGKDAADHLVGLPLDAAVEEGLPELIKEAAKSKPGRGSGGRYTSWFGVSE